MAQKKFEELYDVLFKNREHSLLVLGMTEEEIHAFQKLSTASLDDGEWTISEINQVYAGKYPILFVKSYEKLPKDLSPEEMLSRFSKKEFAYNYTPHYANESAYKIVRSIGTEAVKKREGKVLQRKNKGSLVVKSFSPGKKGDFFCIFISALEPIPKTIPDARRQNPDLN